MADSLAGKTIFITGGSRGIGKAIALRAARDGANIIIAAKTDTPNPKLPGTVHTTVDEIRAAGGQGLGVVCDIRFEDQVAAAVDQAIHHFKGIDILVNNASAINLTDTLATPIKRFDLMMSINVRGTFLTSQACLPHLLKAPNPHILTLCPPIDIDAKWFKSHLAYTISKYGMSMCVLGLAAEFKQQGVAINALWPKTLIATDALNLIDGIDRSRCRHPKIVADAAHAILVQPSRSATGQFYLDEEVLAKAGVRDLTSYALDQANADRLYPDLFL